jgi:hypothetical protein
LWTTWGWEAQPTSPSKLMHSRLFFLDIILGLSEFRFLILQFLAKFFLFGSGFIILLGNGQFHVIVPVFPAKVIATSVRAKQGNADCQGDIG